MRENLQIRNAGVADRSLVREVWRCECKERINSLNEVVSFSAILPVARSQRQEEPREGMMSDDEAEENSVVV